MDQRKRFVADYGCRPVRWGARGRHPGDTVSVTRAGGSWTPAPLGVNA
jgi:hypothetical protein